MSLLLALIVGSLIGGVGGFSLQENYDLLVLNIVMGVAGAVMGSVVYFFAASGSAYLLFSWAGLLSQIIGAGLFVLIFSALHRAAPQPEQNNPLDKLK